MSTKNRNLRDVYYFKKKIVLDELEGSLYETFAPLVRSKLHWFTFLNSTYKEINFDPMQNNGLSHTQLLYYYYYCNKFEKPPYGGALGLGATNGRLFQLGSMHACKACALMAKFVFASQLFELKMDPNSLQSCLKRISV